MSKTAFIFPGQGSQAVGMGKDLIEQSPKAKEIFEQANQALGFDLTKLCLEGPEEELKQTANTQPAILTTSIAQWKILEAENKSPEIVAGHSLGEYSALVAAGVIDFVDAVKLVRLRGKLMEEAVPDGKGTMAAILGLTHKQIADVLSKLNGVAEIANINCPGQIVISGGTPAIKEACAQLAEAGAKRAVMLSVSGPFHSSLMQPAGAKLKAEIDKINFNVPKFKFIANVTADYASDPKQIKELLVKQVSSSVLWQQTVERMLNEGINEFVEVGPGNVLMGLLKKIQKEKVKSVVNGQ
ncbi:MAG: ACP S-malonyltransferase [Candidatus Margulisbacteria bacterium]|nr:ACP S-malonyltransferase [Candidatus Margulisiibacteriota bacterium]